MCGQDATPTTTKNENKERKGEEERGEGSERGGGCSRESKTVSISHSETK